MPPRTQVVTHEAGQLLPHLLDVLLGTRAHQRVSCVHAWSMLPSGPRSARCARTARGRVRFLPCTSRSKCARSRQERLWSNRMATCSMCRARMLTWPSHTHSVACLSAEGLGASAVDWMPRAMWASVYKV
eukprot:scaffold1298_cov382-Prasinococcus_capsulatus_cf.AAC.14